MTESTERDLVLAAQAGEKGAWDRIVSRTRGPLVRFVFSRLRDEAASLDLAQDVYIEGLRSICTMGEPYRLQGWLRRIASRRIARHLAALSRRRSVRLTDDVTAAPQGPHNKIEALLHRLEGLPPHYREVLKLYYLDMQPVRRIADRLVLPVGTVKRRMHIGRRIMASTHGGASRPEKHEVRAVPEIRIRPLPDIRLEIPVCGPLLPYGSLLEEGDVEVFDWYHYPGGLWRERTTSEVRGVSEIAGRACVEIHVDYLSTEQGRWAFEDGADELLYVDRRDDGIHAVLRVYRASRDSEIEVDGNPILDGPFPAPVMVAGREDANGRYEAVDLGVGEAEYGTCLRWTAAFPAEDISGGRSSAAEWLFAPSSRCILMRRYNGPEWDNYTSLERSPAILRDGVHYRLWHDCVLWSG